MIKKSHNKSRLTFLVKHGATDSKDKRYILKEHMDWKQQVREQNFSTGSAKNNNQTSDYCQRQLLNCLNPIVVTKPIKRKKIKIQWSYLTP